MTINIGNGNKIINSIVKENEMKTTYLYENGKKVVFNDQHILDYVNGGKGNWKRHFIGCAIVLGGLFVGVYLAARQEIDRVDQPREINQYEYRDFINFSEWQAVKDMCAATCPGDRDKQIEHFEKWALTKDKQEIKSMLELMDNIPACLPEKNGLLNVLSYDEEK